MGTPRHKPFTGVPQLKRIRDSGARFVFDWLNKSLVQSYRNIFDDLNEALAGDADEALVWNLNNALGLGVGQDGFRYVKDAGVVTGCIISARERGDVGTAFLDLNKHIPTKPITTQRNATPGTTIYTTQANRPQIIGDAVTKTDNAIFQTIIPDVIPFTAGDFFSCDVDSIGGGSVEDVTISLFVSYTV